MSSHFEKSVGHDRWPIVILSPAKYAKKWHFWPKIPNMVIWTKISQKIKILNFFRKNERFLLIAFQIDPNHCKVMIFWKDIAKLPKICHLGPGIGIDMILIFNHWSVVLVKVISCFPFVTVTVEDIEGESVYKTGLIQIKEDFIGYKVSRHTSGRYTFIFYKDQWFFSETRCS